MQVRTADREELDAMATQPGRLGLRASIVILAGKGTSVSSVADTIGCTPATVRLWTRRYQRAGVPGLLDRPRSGRPVEVSESLVLTMSAGLGDARGRTSWTARGLAADLDLSPHTILRVWRRWGVAPEHLSGSALSATRPTTLLSILTAATGFEGILWDAPNLTIAVCLGEPTVADPCEAFPRFLRAQSRPSDGWDIDTHTAERREFLDEFRRRTDVVFLAGGGAQPDPSGVAVGIPPEVTPTEIVELIAACQGFAAGNRRPLARAAQLRQDCEQWWPAPDRVLMWSVR